MAENATTPAAHKTAETGAMMVAHSKQKARDRLVAAADALKLAMDAEMMASFDNEAVNGSVKKIKQLMGVEDEMERSGRELEESVRHVMTVFGLVGDVNRGNENDSMDAEEDRSKSESACRTIDTTAECVFTTEDSPRSVLISTLKRENNCLVAKIKLLEKTVESTEVRCALDAELWAKRIKSAEANASLAVASQRALEVECGAERRRVEHLRETITELNSRLTAAEQATCRARMATVLMEAKHTFETKLPIVDEAEGSVDEQKPSAVAHETNQPSAYEEASFSERGFAQADQDTRSQSSTSSDDNQPRPRSGSLLRSPIGYQPRKCSRSRCLAFSPGDDHAAPADGYTSPLARRSSLHFSPSKTTTPEDRGSRSVRPRSEPPIDHRSAQRPRWKR